jgi:cell division protein ZapA
MGTLQIDVLGTSFSIKASEDEEYLKKLLGYYKKIVEEIKKSGMMSKELHIAILAGIMLCDELYKEKSKTAKIARSSTEDPQGEAEKLAQDMIRKLEQALSVNENGADV